MKSRIGLRVGGFAAVLACAVLVACGGGGGGGGVTPTSPPSTQTPSSAPTGVATASASLTTTANAAATLGAVSTAINSGAIAFPKLTSGTTTASVAMTASVPTGVIAPQTKSVAQTRRVQALGVQSTLAYFAVGYSAIANAASTAITFQLALPSAPTGNCYLLEEDPNYTTWYPISSAVTCAAQMSFNGTLISSQLGSNGGATSGGGTYYFAIATTGNATITTTPPPPLVSASGTGSPLPAVVETPGTHQGFSPYQVATSLNFPVQSGYDGAGQTIVIFGEGPPLQSDLDAFLARMQITRRGWYQVVNINGQDPTAATDGGLGEATLDTEWVLALAPGANVEFYSVADLSTGSFLEAEQYALSDPNNPKIFNESFGGCELGQQNPDHSIFVQGSAEGIAYTMSAGDEGDGCFYNTDASGNNINYFGVNSPASDPNVIGVGGTENMNSASVICPLSSLTSVAVWNDTCLSGPGAGGGGMSTAYTSESPAQLNYPGVTPGGRNVPDISMPAEGASVYLQGKWQVFGGTSWSAPQAAAMIAEIYQACPLLTQGTSQDPAAIFYLAGSSSFIDVTQGTNAFPGLATPGPGNPSAPTPGPGYNAATGYDLVSGIGVPMGTSVLNAICPGGAPVAGAGRIRSALGESRIASYGPSTSVDLHNAIDLGRLSDMGSRDGNATTKIWLTLRNTPTVARDEQSVIAALQGAGFSITRTFPSHTLIVASGSASAINAYFGTQLHDVNEGPRWGVRYANASSTIVPAAIAPFVDHVVADNLIRRKALGHIIR